MRARAIIGWGFLVLGVAAVVHAVTLYALPVIVMNRAMSLMGEVNTIHHGARADANSHGVVRPSPDLLYSTCPYDLSKGPVEIRATIPHDTYWSVSAFDDATNNYFVRDDEQIDHTKLDLVIEPPGHANDLDASARRLVIASPSMRGLILFRTLINDETRFASIDRTRRLAACGPMTDAK